MCYSHFTCRKLRHKDYKQLVCQRPHMEDVWWSKKRKHGFSSERSMPCPAAHPTACSGQEGSRTEWILYVAHPIPVSVMVVLLCQLVTQG